MIDDPAPDPAALERAEVEAAAEAEAATDAAAAEAPTDAAVDRQAALDNDEFDPPTAADYSLAFTPRNVAVGLAIVAGVVAFAASRRRRRRDTADS